MPPELESWAVLAAAELFVQPGQWVPVGRVEILEELARVVADFRSLL